jgi:hypothetical protein
MTSASTTQVLAATRQWLRPVIQVLLRSGVTWREFAELAKTAYVEVATGKFGKRGRPTNVSRTAVLTGLTRREVRRQRERLETALEPLTGYVTKGCLLLAAWHLDPQFLDKNGKPALLAQVGEGPTFEALVRTCGADVPPSTLLKELRSADAICETPDGRLQVLKRSYVPFGMDEQLIRLWGTVLADVATTYVHNLTHKPKTPARFERQAVSDRVAANALPAFQEFLNREGQAFLERLDAWLTEHEVKDEKGKPAADTIRLGAGMYHIQD